MGGGLVAHVQRIGHGHAHFRELGRQVQIALQIRRVQNLHHDGGIAGEDFVAGDRLFGRGRQQAVGSGQVHEFDRPAGAYERRRLFLHGNAGIIRHVLVRTGEPVEYAGLAAVGIARQQNSQGGGVGLSVHIRKFKSIQGAI